MKRLIGIFLLFISSLTYADIYDFVSIEKLIEQEVGRIILPEIYKKLNIKISITPVPGKRAQQMAISGQKDGEIMRIYTYGDENPTMIRVPTPYYFLETMAFVKMGRGIVIDNRDDLKNYNLGKVRGVKHTDNITEGIDNVVDVNTTAQMMKMLENNRIDIALTNTLDGLIILKELGYSDIITMDKPLAVLELYHYIHASKSNIVSEVDSVIKEMIASGEMKELIFMVEKTVIGN